MRGLLVIVVVAGVAAGVASCGGGPDSTSSQYGCVKDSTCPSGEVCARSDDCYVPSELRAVHVSWTVGGMPASATTCSGVSQLQISFNGGGGGNLAFAPVPCEEGKFSIDKLPKSYSHVMLGHGSSWGSGAFDDAGDASLDLPL